VKGDYEKLIPHFAEVRRPSWTPDAHAWARMSASEKLTEEVRLERAFVEFEE
jgi:hypothetical protein